MARIWDITVRVEMHDDSTVFGIPLGTKEAENELKGEFAATLLLDEEERVLTVRTKEVKNG